VDFEQFWQCGIFFPILLLYLLFTKELIYVYRVDFHLSILKLRNVDYLWDTVDMIERSKINGKFPNMSE
jgi:hypothetical protein